MGVSTVKLNGTTLMTVNDTTATASDVAQTKYFYAADGTKTAGTASGGGGAEAGVVNYYDYDGTLIATYSDTEFASLASHPANPSHTGLTAQGWNWSLADAKTYVATYKNLDIGQMYVTDDGKTRLYIEIPSDARGDQLTFYVRYAQSVSQGVVVNWGDGNSETFTGSGTTAQNRTHTYASTGQYLVTLEVVDGTMTINGSSSYSIFGATSNYWNRGRIKKAEIGSNCVISGYAFYYSTNIKSITMPHGLVSFASGNTFAYCYSLPFITLPDTLTSQQGNTFASCYNLKRVSLPKDLTSISTAMFYYCETLERVIIPSGVTSIGAQAFYYCHSISEIVIPNTVTSIGGNGTFNGCRTVKTLNIPSGATITSPSYTFSGCYLLQEINIPSDLTTIGANMFQYCYNIKTFSIPSTVTTIGAYAFNGCFIESITLPSNLTSIGNYAFSSCNKLRSITIPSKVTSLGSNTFNGCYSLTSVTIQGSITEISGSVFSNCYSLESFSVPNTVTTIGTSSFAYCYALKNLTLSTALTTINNTAFQNVACITEITIPSTVTTIGTSFLQNAYCLSAVHMKPTTPPSIGTSAFNGIGSAYTIYVPTGHLSDYQTAQNWSSFAARMVEE